MSDKFSRFLTTLDSPANGGVEIVPSAIALTQTTRVIYVGGDGNLCVQMSGTGNTVLTFYNVSAGSFLPIRVTKVFANSTATNIIGLY